MKKNYKELFDTEKLDERIGQLTMKQAARESSPEQQLVQDLHALHAAYAEHERLLLERVRQRLRASEPQSQLTMGEKEEILEVVSFPKNTSISLPLERKKWRLDSVFQGLVAVLFVGLLVGGSALALWNASHLVLNTTSRPTKNWQTIPGPRLSSQGNRLYGVSASAANDAWAVGASSNGSRIKALVEHWDGQQWSVVVTPNPGMSTILLGVVAITPDDAWAVGEMVRNKAVGTILIEHWNGDQWSVVHAPTPGAGINFLSKVIALSATNVWAVGSVSEVGVRKALIEHWDGKVWSVVPSSSSASTSTFLRGITAISADDMWAVGYVMPTSLSHRAFLEHWDGKSWHIIDVPVLKTMESQLESVSATSSNDVWAVGTRSTSFVNNKPPQIQPLIEHWDGKQWSISSPPLDLGADLWSVQALTPHDVWAVGTTGAIYDSPILVAHWNGKQWGAVRVAGVGSQCQSDLYDIAVIPHSSKLWSVGETTTSSCNRPSPRPSQPLFELYTS